MPTPRFIHQIFTPELGTTWENERLLAVFEEIIAGLGMGEAEHGKLRDFLRFQLVGERSRRTMLEDWRSVVDFRTRAAAFEKGADEALDHLAKEIAPIAEAAGVSFDAVITTTATGNLMPGLSYRLASRLGGLIPEDSLMIDLGNVGCTGSIKALNLARSLDAAHRNILVVAVEVPSTLAETTSTAFDAWQGNCTFGDGAAALWISTDPEQGSEALAVEDIHYRQSASTGIDLIRWGYRSYYTFALADPKTFDQDVREHVVSALRDTEGAWKEEPRWAIHPAGIALLVRISRKLGIPQEAIQPSVKHYRAFSNMSSASIVHILRDLAAETPPGAAINLLTMGAGFNVIYGQVRRVR